MMNKIKSAKVHLIKFLFLLPLMSVLLLAFRGSGENSESLNKISRVELSRKKNPDVVLEKQTFINVDTIPGKKKVNAKGYFIAVEDNKGDCAVVVKDGNGKEIKKLLLTDWVKKEKYYVKMYGEVVSAPSNCDIAAPTAVPTQPTQPSQVTQPVQPSQPSSPESPIKVKSLTATDESNKPLMIVDGVEWPSTLDINMIDANKIETVSVLKDAGAVNQYGNRGKNGVVIIKTKIPTVDGVSPVQVRVKDATITGSPLYYLNGQQTTKETVDLIEPANIKSVDVLKGKKAEEKYGEKGKNGVIEIKAINPVPTRVNYIEKNRVPSWDIRNVLGVKKKDEC